MTIEEPFLATVRAKLQNLQGYYHPPLFLSLCYWAVTLDRDQVKNMGMENFTYAVGNVKEYTAILELYIIGDRYTIRE